MAQRGFLDSLLRPLSNAYRKSMGYQRVGLKLDDLIMEENAVVKEALRRLPKEEYNQRIFRFRRAVQLSITHRELPKEQWTKTEEDSPYLRPYIEEVQKEKQEVKDFYNMKLV